MTGRRKILRAEPECSGSLDAFLRRYAEAAAWCDARADAADAAGSLRHDQLRPRLLARDPFASVWSVSTAREHGLRYAKLAPVNEPGGRLLVYFPEAELSDGAAEVETDGWYDVFNAPPWDTWMAFVEEAFEGTDRSYASYLIAYVPPVFIDLCSRGIEINPEQCIVWLEDADVALRDLLRTHAPALLRPS